MADRNFKLRQMYSDFLNVQRDFYPNNKLKRKKSIPKSNFSYSVISEEDKKKWSLKKLIEDEESETFELGEGSRPILIKEIVVELKWYYTQKPPTPSESLKLKPMDDTMIEALKLIQLFSIVRLLESKSFQADDIRVLNKYFSDDKEFPNERLISVLDYVFSQAILYVVSLGEKMIPKKDLKLKAFLADLPKAKQTILEALLRYPELLPDSWGREKFQQKRKEMKKIEHKRRLDEAKEIKELNEKEKREKEKEKDKEEQEKDQKVKEEKEKTDKEKDEIVETPSKMLMLKKSEPSQSTNEKVEVRSKLSKLKNMMNDYTSKHRADKEKDKENKNKENNKDTDREKEKEKEKPNKDSNREKNKNKEKDKNKNQDSKEKKNGVLKKKSIFSTEKRALSGRSQEVKLKRSKSLLNATKKS